MALAKRMAFFEGGFRYLKRDYLFADVRHVDWWQGRVIETTRRGRRVLLYQARLNVTLANGKVVHITHKAQLGRISSTRYENVHHVMCDAAERLLARTFDVRMDAYEKDFEDKGYVEWGVHQITPDGELFNRHAFCMNLNEPQHRCMLFPYKLVCMRRPKKWWKRLLMRPVRVEEIIDLKRDRDCFLFLLRRHAGLYWPKVNLRLYRGISADMPPMPEAPPTSEPNPSWSFHTNPQAEPATPREEVPPPPPPPPPKPRLGVEHYLGILYLPADATWPDVKAGYRSLAKQHHPDLMRGRGASATEIATAEENLKIINEAYGWLEDYYRMAATL